jgi:hypothetical protein
VLELFSLTVPPHTWWEWLILVMAAVGATWLWQGYLMTLVSQKFSLGPLPHEKTKFMAKWRDKAKWPLMRLALSDLRVCASRSAIRYLPVIFAAGSGYMWPVVIITAFAIGLMDSKTRIIIDQLLAMGVISLVYSLLFVKMAGGEQGMIANPFQWLPILILLSVEFGWRLHSSVMFIRKIRMLDKRNSELLS